MSKSGRRGFLARLFGLGGTDELQSLAPMEPLEPEPVHLLPEEESWLEALITDVGEHSRLSEIGGGEFWQRVDAVRKRGHERLAADWVAKFIDAPATPIATRLVLRARLVELLDEQGDSLAAVPHLEVLTATPEHTVRGHYLLAEHHRRRGDEAQALRHYEAVLARDVSYPNVRARAERLRRARGQAPAIAPNATIGGGDFLGAGGGSRYFLVRELGRGATGVVYLARDTQLERDVAVKLLHPHLAAARSAEACSRFFNEARIAASLRHPNILAVLDLDEAARRIVIEVAAGGTLRTVLKERGPRGVRRALERHAQILSALAAAHQHGVVHRDLKPANLMFRHDPDASGVEIVLGDFGIAHLPDVKGATGADAASQRKAAEAVGTLAYMSPEQRRGDEVAPRSDLYSAAVVLFEMLTGAPPWRRDVLLAGVRSASDFALPNAARQQVSTLLADALQTHLHRLGHPEAASRPTTDEALREAQHLRALAIAEANPGDKASAPAR